MAKATSKSTSTSTSTSTANTSNSNNNVNIKGKEKEQEEANADSLESKQARVSSLKSTEIQSALSHLDSILSLIDSNSSNHGSVPSGSNPNPPGLLQLIPSLLSPLSNLDLDSTIPNHNHSNNNQLNLNLHAQKAFLFRNASNLSNTLLAQLNSITASQTQNASQSTTTTEHSSQSVDQSLKLVNDLLEVLKSTSQEEIKIKKEGGGESAIGNDNKDEDQINRGNRKRKEEKENLLKVRKRRRLMLERNQGSRDGDGDGDEDEDENENGMEKANGLKSASILESTYETNLPYSSFKKSSIDFLSKLDSFNSDPKISTNQFPTISQFRHLLEVLSVWINFKDGDQEVDSNDQQTFFKEVVANVKSARNRSDRVGMKISKWSLKHNSHQPVKKWNDMEMDERETITVKESDRDLICQIEIDLKDFGRGYIDFEIVLDRQCQDQEVEEQTDLKEKEEKMKDWDLRIVTIKFLSQVEVENFQKVSNVNSSSNQNQKISGIGSSSFPLHKDLSSHLLFHSLEDDQEVSELKSNEDNDGIKTNKGLINLVKTIFHLTSLRYFFDSPPKSLSMIEQQVRTAEKIEAISLPTVNNSNQTSNSNLTTVDSNNDIQKEVGEKNGSLNEKTQVQDGNNLNPKESNNQRRKLWSYRRVLQPKIGDGKIRWVYCSKGIGKLGEGQKLEEDQDGEWRGYHVNCTLRM